MEGQITADMAYNIASRVRLGFLFFLATVDIMFLQYVQVVAMNPYSIMPSTFLRTTAIVNFVGYQLTTMKLLRVYADGSMTQFHHGGLRARYHAI